MTGKIIIVGLGNYGIDELPFGVYKFLKQHPFVYTRTLDHPVIEILTSEGIVFQSFDEVYESNSGFNEVYEDIVSQLMTKARNSDTDIVYTVPGHPRVAETTTVKLEAHAQQDDIEIKVLGGKSFIDDIFEAVKVDPNDGFTLLDATSLSSEQLNIRTHTLITQVFSSMTAGDLKVTLMSRYDDEQIVFIIDGAHASGANVIETPLYELDHYPDIFSNLTSVFIKRVENDATYMSDFDYATGIIDRLVDDEIGCPWDKIQTHQTLKRYLLEETFELFEAIDNEDDWHMIEELGDYYYKCYYMQVLVKKKAILI